MTIRAMFTKRRKAVLGPTFPLPQDARREARTWRLHAGVAGYLISWVFFVLGLKRGDLSILYPMVSLSYIWTLFWSKWFFGEPLTRAKFTALGLILAGVALLGLGNR